MYSLYLRYIISYTVNNNAKSAIFSPKVSMITNVILILCNSSINNKLILRDLRFRYHISCFCSISPTKIIPNTAVLHLWATWEWFVPEWINRLNDSVQSQWLIKYLHFLKIISNISFQRFMFQISKHYLCICNCRLAFCVLPSCIKQCVNTSKCHFICIAKIHFVDTYFICLVTAQMQEFDSKKCLKGKNGHKTCWKKKILSLLWTDHTEYEEYQKHSGVSCPR